MTDAQNRPCKLWKNQTINYEVTLQTHTQYIDYIGI